MDTTPTIIECQVDWLRASAHSAELREHLRLCADVAAAAEEALGQDTHAWGLLGYRGWRHGRVRWGERDGAGLLDLSGQVAHDWRRDVLVASDVTTRIDLAVTARYPWPVADVAEETYRAAVAEYDADEHYPRPSLTQDADGGQTCYLGHRSSAWFLRLYNKQAECQAAGRADQADHYRRCWRWELEVKGPNARRVHQTLDGPDDPTPTIQALVWAHCEQHQLVPPWPSAQGRALVAGFTRRSDDDTRLRWLHAQVRGSVRRLLEHHTTDEVLDALGLIEAVCDDAGEEE